NKFLDAEPCKPAKVFLNEVHRLLLAHFDVGALTHLAILTQGKEISRRVKIRHPCAISAGAVAQPKFGAEVITHEHKLAEHAVITNRPGCNASEEDQCRNRDSWHRRLPAPASLVPGPQARWRQERDEHRTVQSGNPPEQSKLCPGFQAVSVFKIQRQPENGGEQESR